MLLLIETSTRLIYKKELFTRSIQSLTLLLLAMLSLNRKGHANANTGTFLSQSPLKIPKIITLNVAH
jgi:hypothetical protein